MTLICSVENCNKSVDTKGLCQMHYTRLLRNNTLERRNTVQGKECIIEGCNKKPVARNLCRTHYYYWWTYGDLDVQKTYKMRQIEKKHDIEIEELCYELHHIKKVPLYKIAKIFDVDYSTICDWFKQFNIKAENRGHLYTNHKQQSETLKKRYTSGEIKIWNKGLTKESDKRVKKYGESHKGYRHTKENLKKMSKATKKHWKIPNYVKKQMQANQVRPNGPELLLDFILQNYFPDEWKYVGDGQVIIEGLCPDFINCNGKKKIIELFGSYWHNRKNMKWHQTEQGRKEIFKKIGFDTLIIWEHELNNESLLLQKIEGWSND